VSWFGQIQHVAVATVFLVGIDELDRIPDYLELGAIVVIAPDQHTLNRWQAEQHRPLTTQAHQEANGVVLDMPGRQVLVADIPLALSDLEYRVLALLMSKPGSAWSFRDLRRTGWGDAPELPIDAASVRSLVQRLRIKLRAAGASVTLQAVRGYGFRLAPHALDATASPEDERRLMADRRLDLA
jgi:DNA-binding response OmpR family regulator